MWYLIITSRCVIWTIMSFLATFMMQEAVLSPEWLNGPVNSPLTFPVNLGVFTECDMLRSNCKNLVSHPQEFPLLWKICTFFLVIGVLVMCLTICIGLVGYFLQSVYKKSIFIIAGAAQVIAGMCFIMGIMLYPMSWGSITELCGEEASPFHPGICSSGSGLWLGVAGTLLTFTSAYLSSTAQKSTNTYKVQEKLNKGYKIVCLV